MNNASIYGMLLTLLALVSGCTQYNGPDGPIYGSWALVGITEHNHDLELTSETVFSFQGEVVQVLRLKEDPPSVAEQKFGNFEISDDILILKFQVAPSPGDNYMYMTPTWLHFPEHYGMLHFEVERLDGSRMVLRLRYPGEDLVYSFRKTW